MQADPERPTSRARLVVLALAVLLGAYFIVAALSMYPVPGGDASGFMTPAINLKAGKGLTNPLWAIYGDPTGQQRWLEQPPLFQQVVSALMWRADTKSAFVVLAIFNALALCGYAALICWHRQIGKLLDSRVGFAAALLSVCGVAFLLSISSAGRPEGVSSLILVLGMLVLTALPERYWPWCLGVAIGTAAAIHPTHGIFFGCLTATVFLLTFAPARAIKFGTYAAVVAFAVFWALLALGPHPLRDVLTAIAAHAGHANSADYRASTLLAYYLRLAPWSGVYLVGLTLTLLWCGLHVWQTARDRLTRWIGSGVLVANACVFWYFSLRSPNKSFYLVMLAPAVAALALYLLANRTATSQSRTTILPVFVVAGFAAFFSLWLARDVVLYANYRSKGVDFDDARSQFGNLLQASPPHVVSVSESLWVLTEDFKRIRIVERGTASGELMVVQQTQRQSFVPPEFAGYGLVSHSFVPQSPTCFGIRVARTMPGYAYAVYEREASQPSAE